MLYYILNILLVGIVTFLLYKNAARIEETNQVLKTQMEMTKNYCELLKVKVDDMRCYRHDLARHIQTLENIVAKDEQTDGVIGDAIDSLNNRMSGAKETYQNQFVEALLASRKELSESKNIPISIFVEENIDFGVISEINLVSLCGNLLDNAIEANEKISDESMREIVFRMYSTDSKLSIEVKNRVNPGEEITFQTTKEEKEFHGLGTVIINKLAEKYDGDVQVDYNKTDSYLTIWLTMNTQMPEMTRQEAVHDTL
ncbi:MAG: GHKL domain-containing protein [Lachnospiraceae bacterium]|nr:GHKL domain-containing protein [Lachnospiraceae bacterium]